MGTRFALILYLRMVAHKAACHTLSKAFLKSMMLEVLFTQDSKVEDLFCGASSGSEPNRIPKHETASERAHETQITSISGVL